MCSNTQLFTTRVMQDLTSRETVDRSISGRCYVNSSCVSFFLQSWRKIIKLDYSSVLTNKKLRARISHSFSISSKSIPLLFTYVLLRIFSWHERENDLVTFMCFERDNSNIFPVFISLKV